MKARIWPDFGKEVGQGGIKRVNEALHRWLPEYGIELVSDIKKADVVNVHADYIDTKDIPVAYSGHGLYWSPNNRWPDWAISANAKLIKAAKHAEAFSVPSRFVHNVFARGMLLDPFVLYHGVELDEWEPAENNGYVFWGKTRTDPVCTPEPLNTLAKLCPKTKFVSTFGDESLSNLTLTGRMNYDRSKNVLKHAGVYLATVQETGGITVLEAMAAGIPALGFAHGVNPEIIKHKETGYLVSVGDYAALREGLYYILEHRERLGANAREFIREGYQWRDRVRDYIPFYENAIAQKIDHSPKVSVIVTAYNLEQYLPACLDSILKQDFEDWECIIVDDASPDKCGEIARDYGKRDSRFKVVTNTQNMYLAESRNIGISCSSGQYILPLDADDEIGEGTLRILADSLDMGAEKDIVTGAFQLIEPNGERWVSPWPPENPSYNQQIRHRNQVPYASMYRRWVWERTGGYRRRWKSAEDAEFWTRAMSYGAVPAKVTNIPTLVYNNRPNSMSHTTKEPDWTAWMIHSRFPEFTPFGASGDLPSGMIARPVLDYDPIEVSVVIPCGPNHDFYLQDALDSVIAQTFQNWECIVINDTGKRWFDDNGKRINPYISGYPMVKFLDCETEGQSVGPAVARNRGIRASTAPYVLFLDADDYLQPLAIDLMYAGIKEFGGFIFGDWYDQLGNYKEAQDFDFRDTLNKMPCSITCLFNKEDLFSVGLFDESTIGWEDWDLMLSLMSNEICGTRIRHPVFTYRYTTGTRREDNYARETEMLKWIKRKHKSLYEQCKD